MTPYFPVKEEVEEDEELSTPKLCGIFEQKYFKPAIYERITSTKSDRCANEPTMRRSHIATCPSERKILQMLEEADLQIRSQPVGQPNGTAGHISGSDRQSSADRSISVTPSQNGEDQPQDLEDEGLVISQSAGCLSADPGDLGREVSDLKNSFIYVSHQLNRIMKAMHVPPCQCQPCVARHQQMNGPRPAEDPTSAISQIFPNATPQQINALADMARTQKPNGGAPSMGQSYAAHQGGGKIVPGPAERKMVAEYARIHGAVAAAKRFGVPPPVSTYYQRKDSSNSMIAAQLNTQFGSPLNTQQPTPTTPGATTASPGPSSEGENDGAASQPTESSQSQGMQQMPVLKQQAPNQQQQTPQSVPQSPMFPPTMMDMLKMNAAHSTGSPGFLRGRGRGRPKLIGDELDADLVEYMVTVKQADPHGHLTASQALAIAKQYILEKAPGLLEEHGGHVKLKLTWAMKLVSRITERQKEMELGLPPGSLSNMGRTHLNNLPGGNFMADMVAQNILSQHMMMGMNNGMQNGASHSSEQPSTTQENEEPVVGATPEILNVKELNMRFLNDLFNGNSEDGVVEGELPQTVGEKTNDVEMAAVSN